MKHRPASPPVAGLALALLAGCGNHVVDAVRVGVGPEPPDAAPDARLAEDPPDGPAPISPDTAPDQGPPSAARSCRELLLAQPASPDGYYDLDTDADPQTPPIRLFCDMTGGGFTIVRREDFSNPVTGYTVTARTTCGSFGTILGGYNVLSGGEVSTRLDLAGVPHTELRVRFDFIVIDSWDDGEEGFAELDGTRFWSAFCPSRAQTACGRQGIDECGWKGTDSPIDGRVIVNRLVPHTAGSARLVIGTNLNQGAGDESWGIDNLEIGLR